MIAKKALLVALLFFQLFNCAANSTVDSLALLLEQSEGEGRVDLLNQLSWELKYSDSNRAFQLCEKSTELATSINYEPGAAQAFYQLAAMHYIKVNYSKAILRSNQSSAIFKKLDNSAGLAKNWNLRGLIHFKKGEYDLALEQYGKTFTISKALEDAELNRTARANIASVYFQRGDYKKNLELLQELIAEELRANGASAQFYVLKNSIGRTQMALGNYPKALSNLLEVGAYQKSENQLIQLIVNYNYTGSIYINLDLLDLAEDIFGKALHLAMQEGKKKQESFINENLGILFSEKGELEKSEAH